MQNNDIPPSQSYLPRQKIVFWAKIGVLLLVTGYVGLTLYRQQASLRDVATVWQSADWTSLTALSLLALTPVNWALEARKWQLLIQPVEPVSFSSALRGVLAGLSLGMALPASVGDATGRVLSLRSAQRGRAIGAMLVSGGLQAYVAVLVGTASFWLTPVFPLDFVLFPFVLLSGLALAGLRHRLERLGGSRLQAYRTYWNVAAGYTNVELGRAFGLALLRHLTFTLQFALALQLFHISLPVRQLLSGIGFVFLGKTLLPAFTFLGDLGIREATSLLVFDRWGLSAPALLTATLTLWLVNVLLPVLAGLPALWKLNLQKAP